MKQLSFILILSLLLTCLAGCVPQEDPARIAATTLPVYEFTAHLCQGTGITVTRLVTQEVSCLHDYSLNVRQVKAAEAAERISSAGMPRSLKISVRRFVTISSLSKERKGLI